jgi:hypothetical protein
VVVTGAVYVTPDVDTPTLGAVDAVEVPPELEV